MKILVDAMGGDNAPLCVLQGVSQAAAEFVEAGICLCLAFALPQAGLGLLLKGEWKAAPAELALYIGLSFALMFAFTVLFTLIAMLCQNKAHTMAGCILLTFALLFAGVYISSTLEEPEYLAAYSYTENGVTVEEPEQKNPYYISGVNAHSR